MRLARLTTLLLLLVLHVTMAQDTMFAFLDDSNILQASREWMADPQKALVKYGHISTWDTSNVTNMAWLFVNGPYRSNTDEHGGAPFTAFGDSTFNEDISGWDTSNVKDMTAMFYYCSHFDQDLSTWDVSKVTDMSSMFERASGFTGRGLETWKTVSLESLDSTFQGATSFNGDISRWQTFHVETLMGTFADATSFNSDISNWDVSNVQDMIQTFEDATSFNIDLNSWNVSKVQRMVNTFYRARSFDQDLCWDLNPQIYLVDTFCGSKASFDSNCVSEDQLEQSKKDCCRFSTWTKTEIMILVSTILCIVVICMLVCWIVLYDPQSKQAVLPSFKMDETMETATVHCDDIDIENTE